MSEKEPGACVAPGCEFPTPSRYHRLCAFCTERVKEAMIRARPSLLEMMTKECDEEATAWFSSPWLPPSRRWAILDDKHHEVPLDTIVQEMVDETIGDWSSLTLGFVDDGHYARWEAWRQKHDPESEPRKQTGWRLGSDSPAVEAWRTYLEGLLRPVLEQALQDFPLRWAGYEIKTALVQQDGYDADAFGMAEEELAEGTRGWPISEAAREYVEVRFDPKWNPAWELDEPADEYWWRYTVLAPEIMAILDAVKAVETARELSSIEVGQCNQDVDTESGPGVE